MKQVKKPAQLILSYRGLVPDEEFVEWVKTGSVAGVVLFAENCTSLTQLTTTITELQAVAPNPLRVMIDEEGGRVRRLPSSISPMADIAAYGARNDVVGVAKDYAKLCRSLTSLSIDTLLAPVVDIRTTDNDWLGDRCFSADPRMVNNFAGRAVQAIQNGGLSACLKHFPGLGAVQRDLHQNCFRVNDTEAEVRARDLPPFQAAIAAGVRMVMVAHAVYPAFDASRPAVFSPLVVDDLLKKELGFTGLVLTDDLAMGAIARTTPIERAVEQALDAGCDYILICKDRTLQRRAVHFVS